MRICIRFVDFLFFSSGLGAPRSPHPLPSVRLCCDRGVSAVASIATETNAGECAAPPPTQSPVGGGGTAGRGRVSISGGGHGVWVLRGFQGGGVRGFCIKESSGARDGTSRCPSLARGGTVSARGECQRPNTPWQATACPLTPKGRHLRSLAPTSRILWHTRRLPRRPRRSDSSGAHPPGYHSAIGSKSSGVAVAAFVPGLRRRATRVAPSSHGSSFAAQRPRSAVLVSPTIRAMIVLASSCTSWKHAAFRDS